MMLPTIRLRPPLSFAYVAQRQLADTARNVRSREQPSSRSTLPDVDSVLTTLLNLLRVQPQNVARSPVPSNDLPGVEQLPSGQPVVARDTRTNRTSTGPLGKHCAGERDAVGTILQRMDGQWSHSTGKDITLDTSRPRTDRRDLAFWAGKLLRNTSRPRADRRTLALWTDELLPGHQQRTTEMDLIGLQLPWIMSGDTSRRKHQ